MAAGFSLPLARTVQPGRLFSKIFAKLSWLLLKTENRKRKTESMAHPAAAFQEVRQGEEIMGMKQG